ncbi:uncharacterized protein LOC112203031 [Rosa chinensis]|uniref:uncharacterized protein LOC112203031 n=1 Tax=Rosa chinensis TaxID=74649 RepID=UPI000D091C93|nr:uncharacterized protein LOC112203031 [Rosa chinensis]
MGKAGPEDDVPPSKDHGKTHADSSNPPPSEMSKSNLSNPYYTHHSDHPGLVLVSKPLNGDNYGGWKRAMTPALNSKNKLGFVNGTIKAPLEETDPEGYATWSRCNDMVHSWIINTIDPEITDSVIYYPTAHEVWEDFRERFSQGNAPRIFEIQREIACLRQEQMSVSAYYTKLKGLWDELATYSEISSGPQAEQQRLMQFLMGLNSLDDSFAHGHPKDKQGIGFSKPSRTTMPSENHVGEVVGDDNGPTVTLTEAQFKQFMAALSNPTLKSNSNASSSPKANAVTKPGCTNSDPILISVKTGDDARRLAEDGAAWKATRRLAEDGKLGEQCEANVAELVCNLTG